MIKEEKSKKRKRVIKVTKFYKNLKTGAVITEEEYKEKMMSEVTETSSDMGDMSMGGYSIFVSDVFEGQLDDFNDYVPFVPENAEETE